MGTGAKYAGFDGIFVRGKASEPVYLWIDDDRVEIRSARDLWGCGIYETQERIMEQHGNGTRILTIGQTGENLSRIAIISTETESSAGQGGYGAVMGSKKLKAIAVRGSGALRIAHPNEFIRKSKSIAKEAHAHMVGPRRSALIRSVRKSTVKSGRPARSNALSSALAPAPTRTFLGR